MSMPDRFAATTRTVVEPFDFLGLGFGPSNLSIAIALYEQCDGNGSSLRSAYLDAKDEFSWHSGMLLGDSRLQVVFLKDLITMENPRSRFTFINYLHEKGRLHEFINLRTFYPTRAEFNDYYRWVADHFHDSVRYGRTITGVSPIISSDGTVSCLRVSASNNHANTTEEYYARNLTIGLGGKPRIPTEVTASTGNRLFHSSECLWRLNATFPDIRQQYHFLLVGSGQTSADILYYLINHYPNARISLFLRGFGFKPQDDTHFVNELFLPDTTDLFFELDERTRKELLSRHKDVTHSAVDIDLLPLLYDALYNDKVTGQNRIHIHRLHLLREASETAGEVRVCVHDIRQRSERTVAADALILATGYDLGHPTDLLSELEPYLEFGSPKMYRVERSYAIVNKPMFIPKIYLQGYCEPTHGFSEVLLSLLPVRSVAILKDLQANCLKMAEPRLVDQDSALLHDAVLSGHSERGD